MSGVPCLSPQARGSGVPGSGLMRAPAQPRLSPRHWNPSTPSYLPGQTPRLIAAMLTCQSAPLAPPHLWLLRFCSLPLQAHPAPAPAGRLLLCSSPCPTGLCPSWGGSGPPCGLPAIPVVLPARGKGGPLVCPRAGLQQLGPRGAGASSAGSTELAGAARRVRDWPVWALGPTWGRGPVGQGPGPALGSGHRGKQPSVCLGPGSLGAPTPFVPAPSLLVLVVWSSRGELRPGRELG